MPIKESLKNNTAFLKIKFIWFALAILAIFIGVMAWTPKNQLPAVRYLPSETTFYYQWSNPKTFDQKILDKLPIIDASIPKNQLARLQQLLLDGFGQAQEVVWFQIKNNKEDYYLLRFDKPKPILKWLEENQSDYLFAEVGEGIILISHSADLVDQASKTEHLDLMENNLGQGINIYWSTQDSPDFLNNLSDWLKIPNDNPFIFANIKVLDSGKIAFNLWQNKLRQVINATSTIAWPNDAKIPYNIDLALGFSSVLGQEEQDLLKNYVLQPLLANLPYYKLGQKDLNKLMQNNFILQNSDGWLMVSQLDWKNQAASLLPEFNLVEVKKVLPDGTAYIEYLASSSNDGVGEANGQNIKEYDYRGHYYWQIGELYGMESNGYYYLSNHPSLLEKTIISQTKLVNLVSNCPLSPNSQVKDLVRLQVNLLPDNQIKQVLSDRGINELFVVSYENNQSNGWQACF